MGDDENGGHVADEDHDDTEDGAEEYEPTRADDILGSWEFAGWQRWLPNTVVFALELSLDEDGRAERTDFDRALAELTEERVGDDLWVGPPELTAEERAQATASGIDVDAELAEHRAAVAEQRDRWLAALARLGRTADTTDDVLAFLAEVGLIEQAGGVITLTGEVPDPIKALQLDEADVEHENYERFRALTDETEDALYDLFTNPPRDSIKTTLDRLGEATGMPAEIVRASLVVLISDPESGFAADRFGPLQPDVLLELDTHQTFTLTLALLD